MLCIDRTVRAWLRQHPPARSAEELTTLLATYRDHYNHRRRKNHLGGLTPAQRYALGPLAEPGGPLRPATAISTAIVSASGCIGIQGHLVGIGRRHSGTRVTLIRRQREIAIFRNDQLIAHIDLKPQRRYQRANTTNSARLSTIS